MYKILVCDFKNTLIDKEESIDSKIIIEIDKYRRSNNKFIISTDLNYNEILYYNKSYDFIDYIISYSGSIIYDIKKDKVIYKKHILVSKLKKLIKNTKCILYSIDSIYDKDNYIDYIKNNKIYRIDIYNNKDNLKLVNELKLDYYIDEDIIIITGSNINNSIKYIIKDKYNDEDILCIGYDNKYIDCNYKVIGLSNTKLNIKKIKYNNNELGIKKIIEKI